MRVPFLRLLAILPFLFVGNRVEAQDPTEIATAAADVASFINSMSSLFGKKPDTNAEILNQLNTILGRTTQIEKEVQLLGKQLEAAKVATMQNEDRHWQVWESSLYDSPVGQYVTHMSDWKATLDQIGNQPISASVVQAHADALNNILRLLNSSLAVAPDFGGVVYAPAYQATFVADNILDFLASNTSDAQLKKFITCRAELGICKIIRDISKTS
jgi:hypothetical protein